MCNISEYVTCTYIIFHNMRLDAILFYKLCALHSLAFAKMLITAPNYKKVIQYHIYFVHHFLYFCKMKSQAIWQQCTGNGRKLSYEWKPRKSLGRHVIQYFVTFALKRIYWNKMLQRIFSLSLFFKQLVSQCIKKIVHNVGIIWNSCERHYIQLYTRTILSSWSDK